MNTTIDSKDQNRINIFMAAASQEQDAEQYGQDTGNYHMTAKLALYNMGIEAKHIALDMFKKEFNKDFVR